MYKKKKKPLTTHGWLTQQAEGVCERIDEILTENHIESTNFRLVIGANVIRTICNIVVVDAKKATIEAKASLFERYNPFDNTTYWDQTQKYIIKKYGFKKVQKLPNVREYEFTF